MTSYVLASPLVEAMTRQNMQQKYVSVDSKTPQATLSDHMHGKKGVSIQKAEQYANSIKDSRLNLEMAQIFFGSIPVMTGTKHQQTPLALDVLQEKESSERKELKQHVREILTLSEGELNSEERNVITNYTLEFIDEIVVEVTLLASLADLLGTTVEQLVAGRLPYLTNIGFMRKGK